MSTAMSETEVSLMAIPLHSSASSYEEVIEQYDDGYDEQYVNQTAADVNDQPTQQPEDDENNHDSPKNTG